ncbi:MAG TPA: DNA methyltransferase [Candidatus Gracilibacteria bacterium]
MYLLLTGRYPELSAAELAPWCEITHHDKNEGWLLADNLRWDNPRELPKPQEQIFLDRLGGTQRIAEVIGEYFTPDELQNQIIAQCTDLVDHKTFLIGFSFFGTNKGWGKKFMFETYDQLRHHFPVNIRLANPTGENLTSGRIFHDKLLKKGTEFIIIHKGDSWLLTQTKANQNLRNYELRDRKKDFRDSNMGMLPPKLAQILLNLAQPSFDDTVIDPFCGSGTINIEAAISGYRTFGSDLDKDRTQKAHENFEQMALKFRYDAAVGDFKSSDALKLDWKNQSGVVATEGWLGENFVQTPRKGEIDNNAEQILELWRKLLPKISESKVHSLVFCLPAWSQRGKLVSIFQKLLPTIHHTPYTIRPFESGETFFYQRPDAFVAREIVVLKKS